MLIMQQWPEVVGLANCSLTVEKLYTVFVVVVKSAATEPNQNWWGY